MTLSSLYGEGLKRLIENGIPDSDFDCSQLFEYALDCGRTKLLTYPDLEAEDEAAKSFLSLIDKRCTGYPLQYILGSWEFMGLGFAVGEGVLIPRPETEILVFEAQKLIPDGTKTVIYDLCAGSGAIGLTLAKKNGNTEVYLFEKYDAALGYLEKNKKALGADNAHIIKCDVLKNENFDIPKPDLILSNPPYIPSGEIASLQTEVGFEPKSALDGGEDGLMFYRAILKYWFPLLSKGGSLIVECAEDQSEKIKDLFSEKSHKTEAVSDFNNIDRIVKITV